MISPFATLVADPHQRTLRDAGGLVGALELLQPVDVDARPASGRAPRWRARRYGSRRPGRRRRCGAPRSRRRNRAPRSAPCRCRRAAPRRCTSGTAWRCMLEPISARLASSFSRNGMSAAATETSCFGDTSMRSTLSRRHHDDVAGVAADDQVVGEAALRRRCRRSPGRRCTSPPPWPRGRRPRRSPGRRSILRYGLSMKPYLFTRAKVASELIRPIFGPSGVSIGQMRP